MRSYLAILKIPGALAFSAAGLMARFGGAMVGIGTVLMIQALYQSYGQAGILAAANSVAWAVGTAILSHLVDRHGQRRIMLPTALVSAVALTALVVLALCHAPIGWLIPCTIVAGFTGGSPGAMVRARWNYVLDDPRDLHTAFSLESSLDEITFAVGPVLATWLSTSVNPAAGLAGPIVLGAGGALVFYSLRATQPQIIPLPAHSHEHRRFLLAFPGIAMVLGVGALMGALFGSLDITVVAATTAWDVRPLSGLVLGVMSVGSAIGGLAYGARGWVSPLWRRFTIGVCILGVTVCSLFFATNAWVLGVCGFVAGLAIAPTFINANALIGHLVPATRLTEGLAWLGTGIGIGVSIGSMTAGAIIDRFGFHGGFACVVVAGLLACVLGLIAAPILKAVTKARDAADRATAVL
ncbi:MAG: MFS transporter [Propionibacteriaceae bacterium]|nr:MFS transporter [Propionibacteriaceae bacterium]